MWKPYCLCTAPSAILLPPSAVQYVHPQTIHPAVFLTHKPILVLAHINLIPIAFFHFLYYQVCFEFRLPSRGFQSRERTSTYVSAERKNKVEGAGRRLEDLSSKMDGTRTENVEEAQFINGVGKVAEYIKNRLSKVVEIRGRAAHGGGQTSRICEQGQVPSSLWGSAG